MIGSVAMMAIFVMNLLLDFDKKRFTDKAGMASLINFSTITDDANIKSSG
ncbi:hypothetical protein L6273_02035 [Candidatus Parcubacteria bacterium]|nr:hypothetical protein [Candidatus Parcubacteria bacterium]